MAASKKQNSVRRLILVLGDQLDHDATIWNEMDPRHDAVWMAETHEETTHVWCHKLRIVFFLSAMRHFRDELEGRGYTVHYTELPAQPSRDRGSTFADLLTKDLPCLQPEELVVTQPGDHRVHVMLKQVAAELGLPLTIQEDAHFYCTPAAFATWAEGRKRLTMEDFYRRMRRQHHVLMTTDGDPQGGDWNFDKSNRETFGKEGPASIKPPRRFRTDATTEAVIELVHQRFPDHPGSLDHMNLPVTGQQAAAYLQDFIEHRLRGFGTYEDAMWTDEAFLYHSRLSAALNLKLISPRACIEAAVTAYREGVAPINDVEGFVRQILGWREFMRGIYWLHMPGYAEHNALDHQQDVPSFFWDGDTDMHCVADAMNTVIQHGYAHHIQRLMVLGEFALLSGVHPYRFHQWHMAMYLDAVDWVSLPNALGMSQYGDGGIVATKPYCASGKYIQRMGNYCKECPYNPAKATGDDACPFTTLYWDFLDRHRDQFESNRRMLFQVRNLQRKPDEELEAIRQQARALQDSLRSGQRI